jgi:hypothetical protein
VHTVSPEEAPYLPAAQLVHAVCSFSSWYWPAGQSVHAVSPVDAPYVPPGHEVQLEADDGEKVPVPQMVFVVAPSRQ